MITNTEDFFGRKEEVEDIYGRIKNGGSIAVCGEKRMGRSSLLNYICREKEKFLDNPEKYIFIFIDIQGEDIKSRVDFFSVLLRKLYEKVSDKIVADKNLDNYENIKRNISELHKAGYILIFFMDEFDLLINNKNFDEDFYSKLRGFATNYGIAYVIATLKEVKYEHYGDKSLSPFFNIFSSIRLSLLKREEAIKLVEGSSAKGGVSLKDYSDFILDIAGPHPYLLRIACSIVFECKSKKEKLDNSDYERIKEELIQESKAYFDQIWDNLSSIERDDLLKLANLKPVDKIYEYGLKDLERKGYVIKREEKSFFKKTIKYDIFSSVFKEFVIEKGY